MANSIQVSFDQLQEMSTDSSYIHPSTNSNELRKTKHPRTGYSMPTNFKGSKVSENFARFYENPLRYRRNPSPSPKPQTNRIHSHNRSNPSATPPTVLPSLSSTATNERYLSTRAIVAKDSSYAANPANPWSVGSINPPPIRPPNKTNNRAFSTLGFSSNVHINKITPRSLLNPSSPVRPQVERHITTSDQMMSRNHEIPAVYTTRYPQGHKAPPRSRSAIHTPETAATTRDFDRHRREIHTIVSALGSRIGALEGTIAAALPVVAEARLLWMENSIVRASAKLGTTRRAFCEYYGNPRYETYSRSIRTRAYYLGLTLDDLEYLQARLESLGSQSGKRETLLISPFGGANETGDKTMIEAYRRDSKHGGYARRIWRVCYESVYSVDKYWMPPVPTPDNLTLVEKIRGWMHGA